MSTLELKYYGVVVDFTIYLKASWILYVFKESDRKRQAALLQEKDEDIKKEGKESGKTEGTELESFMLIQ